MGPAHGKRSAPKRQGAVSAGLPLTEELHPSTHDLDALSTHDLLHRINDEDRRVAWAVEREIDVIASAVDAITERLRGRGKLHYFGAGTSGRIAVLDAAEIPPTFSEHGRVVAHVAGGAAAMTRAIEEAEDDARAGAREVRKFRIGKPDAVLGISASGSTPYVLGAMRAAAAAGALTIGMCSSPQTPLAAGVQIPIVLLTGPEVIAGSTRMKAGSAQKMALTMISSAVMVKLGKTYGNLMVDVKASNAKLRSRARRLTALLSQADTAQVERAMRASGYDVKVAVVMLRLGMNRRRAEQTLRRRRGSLRAVLSANAPSHPARQPAEPGS